MSQINNQLTILGTQNVRPEVAIVIKNGTVAFEGEVPHIPADVVKDGVILILMHTHTKARMDGLIQRSERAAREQAKKEARRGSN